MGALGTDGLAVLKYILLEMSFTSTVLFGIKAEVYKTLRT